jgi:hypothetical protein
MGIRLVVLALISPLALSCARYPTPPPTETPTGSVTTLPAFVFDPSSAVERGGTTFHSYLGCAATYVAPHLLVTSATAFPKIAPGERRSDAPIVVRTPEGSKLHVMGVAYLDSGDGIAIIRTLEVGHCMPLSTFATPQGPLTAVGFRYGPMPADRSLPPTETYQSQVVPVPEPYSAGGTFIRFRISPLLESGACGTPLVDRDGNFAGMVHELHGSWLSAISAPAIATALHRAH